MAELLKNNFNTDLINRFGNEIRTVWSQFDVNAFEKFVFSDNWEEKELKARMRHITIGIHKHLNLKYESAVKVLVKVAPEFGGFEAMVFPDFVENYGLKYENLSLEALKEMTKYSSSEFAIRPFIKQNRIKVMECLTEWSKDKNQHVRRLASEGCRPRLPWAMALPDFKKDPKPILPILENLKNDESLYVRKSVANNINDIAKDNPEVALNLGENWYGKSEKTNWTIKHGLRTLLKKGDERALNIFGFNDCSTVKVDGLELSADKVKIGGDLIFKFSIEHNEKKTQFLKIGFVISYKKSSNKSSDKIFHMTEKEFDPGIKHEFKKKISFKDLSTRKHYIGDHSISILINGNATTKKNFILTH